MASESAAAAVPSFPFPLIICLIPQLVCNDADVTFNHIQEDAGYKSRHFGFD